MGGCTARQGGQERGKSNLSRRKKKKRSSGQDPKMTNYTNLKRTRCVSGRFLFEEKFFKEKMRTEEKCVLLGGKTSQVILLKAENAARGAFCLDESWLLLPYGQVIRHSARPGFGNTETETTVNDDAGQFSVYASKMMTKTATAQVHDESELFCPKWAHFRYFSKKYAHYFESVRVFEKGHERFIIADKFYLGFQINAKFTNDAVEVHKNVV